MRIRFPRRTSRWHLAGTAIVAIAALVATLIAAPAAPANAAANGLWQLTDGFESNPASTWSFGGNPACGICGYFSTTDPLQAHSGTAWASVQAMASNSFFSVGRIVHLSPVALHASTCAAQIYVKLPAGQLNFEVINPATFAYIALTTIYTTSNVNYRAVTVGPWTPGPIDVLIRVSVVRNGNPPTTAFANVDDLTVQCYY